MRHCFQRNERHAFSTLLALLRIGIDSEESMSTFDAENRANADLSSPVYFKLSRNRQRSSP